MTNTAVYICEVKTMESV